MRVSRDVLRSPTPDDVVEISRKFGREYGPMEWILQELFDKFPENARFAEVIVKTKVLNTLYNTQIRAVNVVAQHICEHAIDSQLRAGRPEVVQLVATVQLTKKIRCNLSFASKYCSWHNPSAYPIFDKNVNACLWYYKNLKDRFSVTLTDRSIHFKKDEKDYPKFVAIVDAFRDAYGLSSFTYKEIDKLLWYLGDRLLKTGR